MPRTLQFLSLSVCIAITSCDLILPYAPAPRDNTPDGNRLTVDGLNVDDLSTTDGSLSEDADSEPSVDVPGDVHPEDGSQIDSANPDDLTTKDSAIDVATPTDLQPDPDSVTPDILTPDTLAPDTLAPDTLAPDTVPSCGPLEELCDGVCVNTGIDVNNCGECGNSCLQGPDDCLGQNCVLSQCVPVQKVDGAGCTVGASLGQCFDGSCCTGCWDGNKCRSVGAEQNKSHCGSAGVTCYACTGSMACISGDCM